MQRYNPSEIEPKWQKVWEDQGIYRASEEPTKPKKYILEYFPYPSGAAMHVGHVRNYTIGDAVARHARMKGFNVLHPMGWDAFGLPAENYAIKNNISPRQAIAENTGKFKKQLMQMGFSYDWSREINSSDPSYYKWTQWFFKLLFERGLAYQKDSLQWWCDFDKTVLANEQVESGKCWRCGNPVVKKALKQWFFKITDYADRLSDDLDKLDWSDAIKAMQRNWIGKSQGAEIDFKVDGHEEAIKVFTTRADTLFGATFMVLAPEHPLVPELTTDEHRQHVNTYVKAAETKTDVERQETDREKTGAFTGSYAVNPINGNKLPIWVADYVLYGYGTGAIMAVPAHDERDYEFASTFNLPITQVVMPIEDDVKNPPKEGFEDVRRDTVIVHLKDTSTGNYALLDWHESLEGITTAIMGGIEDGQTAEDAARAEIEQEAGITGIKIIKQLRWTTGARYCASHKQQNRTAITTVLLAEVDDLTQQQPIEEHERKRHTLVWVGEDEALERLVPDHQKLVWRQLHAETAIAGQGEMMNSGEYDGQTTAEARQNIIAALEKQAEGKPVTNYRIRDWLISRQRYWGAPIPIVYCEKDGAVAVPDDQLPVELPEVESYAPTGEGTSVLASVESWVNTTCPKCGGPAKRETDTMDGFACSSWYFLRFADPHNDEKAFDADKAKFWLPVDDYIGGAEHAVMHLLYARMWTKVMHDAGLIEFDEPFTSLRNHGMILAPDGRKMSKSWGNVIAPDDIIDQGYGADAIRIMELFIGPWNQQANWSVEGMGGCFRFLQRVWTLSQEHLEKKPTDVAGDTTELERVMHRTIKQVSQDLEEMGFNTAIASLMECVNTLYKLKTTMALGSDAWNAALSIFMQLLAPFAPHIAEELWQQLGQEGSVHISQWPVWDETLLVEDTMTIAIQVNGKLRGEVTVAKDATQETVQKAALADENVVKAVGGRPPSRVVYVPGRLLNIVITS